MVRVFGIPQSALYGIFVLSGVKALAEAERQKNGTLFCSPYTILLSLLWLGGADASVDTDASLMQNWVKHHNVRLGLVFGALVLSVLENIAP